MSAAVGTGVEIGNEVRYETRGFEGSPGPAIAAATVTGLAALFLFLLLGAPWWLAMGALLAGIVALLGRRAGRSVFVLEPEGLRRTWRRGLLGRTDAPRETLHRYDRIASYRRSRDLARRGVERETLRIRLAEAPRTLVITDEADPAAFTRFADAFERAARAHAEARPEAAIRVEPGFYRTRLAKGVALFFAAVLGAMVFLGATGALSTTSLLRLGLIVVPGTLYLLYRAFLRPD